MASPKPTTEREPKARRLHASRAAFLFGLPVAVGILGLFQVGPLRHSSAHRYVSHPVEAVEVVMFCVALGALAAKLWSVRIERRALRTPLVPPWDGTAIPPGEAETLRTALRATPPALEATLLVKRIRGILDFLCCRGSADGLDDHVRGLADNDALALEGSYALTRFITWAIPILGFLGTVLGITGAISGVTPEVLEHSISTVTDGLALAFDATALALALTMLLMFLSFLVERAEQAVLDSVDRYADTELAHRFERATADGGVFAAAVRRNTDVLAQSVEQLVRRQADIWAVAAAAADARRLEAEQKQEARLMTALEAALEKTLEAHGRRLGELEKKSIERSAGLADQLAGLAATIREAAAEQQAALAQVAEAVTRQLETLEQMQRAEGELRKMQETLDRNLTTLAATGTLEEAVHSLTAAIHLLTARSPTGGVARAVGRPGTAA
jgi:biopolymer transport protein ExbB/TolQ